MQPVAVDSFTAAPATVTPGEPVLLSWETAFAAACSIDQGIGPVPTSGSMVVQPQLSTTYTLTAEGRDPVTRAVTVEVGST